MKWWIDQITSVKRAETQFVNDDQNVIIGYAYCIVDNDFITENYTHIFFCFN